MLVSHEGGEDPSLLRRCPDPDQGAPFGCECQYEQDEVAGELGADGGRSVLSGYEGARGYARWDMRCDVFDWLLSLDETASKRLSWSVDGAASLYGVCESYDVLKRRKSACLAGIP